MPFTDPLAKGRTNYELYPDNYILRGGVAQTMTMFKPKVNQVRRPASLLNLPPQQQPCNGSSVKQTPAITPIRVSSLTRSPRACHPLLIFLAREGKMSTNSVIQLSPPATESLLEW